ncbi:Ig-like domain-containing protein [Stigmatella sp. ncwal1]|uniref:Ig-like domain-containing protein n=1 Tax=Stigmatella ashevillensis TaxID=2995309 RepID=A0ABT5DRU5_9BACT|nr:Ig-like domain-containing protein [Stigmatella ashevillena]MDC0715096.1 Ig-like domain-containing protein [Stigmatella ashevillena]
MSRWLSPLTSLLLVGWMVSACGEDKPENRLPTLNGPTVISAEVASASPVTLQLTASDPDGDTLTYAWTQEPETPAGTFSSTSTATPTWTAPAVSSNQRFTLKVTVADGKAGSAEGKVEVMVTPPVIQNRPPTLTGPAANLTTVDALQSISLSVAATDPDGDALTYVWTQVSPASPVGTFSSASAATTDWTAPEVGATGPFTLRVAVSDGRGGSVQGSVDITVQKVNRPPSVVATISAPTSLIAGTTGTFSINATDPDGDPLTYSWSQTSPAVQGTFVGGRTGTSAQWFSPAVGAETSFTISVTVSDGQGASVTREATVPVTVPLYGNDIQPVWSNASCLGCHGASGNLSLASGSSYSNLVNVNAGNATCNTLKRVTPNDPDNSELIRKMEGTACGNRMPRNNPAYFDNNPGQLVRVRSWILGGALNN